MRKSEKKDRDENQSSRVVKRKEKTRQQKNHTYIMVNMREKNDNNKLQHQIKTKKSNTRKKRTDTLTTGLTWNNFLLTPHIKLLIYLIKWQAMCQCKIGTK